MMNEPADTPARLRALVRERLRFAHTPFSQRPEAAVLLLRDGSWIPGVRVESASYSLVIPAIQNAVSTAIALGRRDLAAVFLSRPITANDLAYLEIFSDAGFTRLGRDGVTTVPNLPYLADFPLTPFLEGPPPMSPAEGLAYSRMAASRAFVPESDFPVGCVIETTEGHLIPGVNVEYADWSRILCAERNALGTLVSYGIASPRALYLTCTRDPGCTPCGACRQLIAELTPEAVLWMDAYGSGSRSVHPSELLPEAFSGSTLSGAPRASGSP
jgi:homotetrameric cytidine deaminase